MIIPAKKQARDHMYALERKRRDLNNRTFEALDETPDLADEVPTELLRKLHELRNENIVIEKEVENLLADRSIREEQGLRAGATTVMLQLSLLLRQAEIRCAQLAFIRHDDSAFQETLRFANGDLDLAHKCGASIGRRYLKPLQSRAIRRERLARRVVWILTLKWKGALDRDGGVNDIRQELRGLESLLKEVRAGLRIFANDFFSDALRAAAHDYAHEDDGAVFRRLSDIVGQVVDGDLDPADENYPVLINRLWAIRARLNELPAWKWSMQWRAYAAVTQSWLYFFATTGAQVNGDFQSINDLLQQAFDVRNEAARLIAEIAVLQHGLKPVWTSFGMIGRQKEIPGFGPPPQRVRLIELFEEIGVRLNARHGGK